jgi:hypothetical protein
MPGKYIDFATTASFKFIIHLSTYHPTLCTLDTEKRR